MYSLNIVVVFSILALVIGAIVGALVFRHFGRQGKLTQNLEQQLKQAEKQLEDYQSDVTEHFEETSRRVNTLTQNYKDVHEYLASSAMKLTNPQMSKAISQAAQQNLPHDDSSTDTTIIDEESAEHEPLIDQDSNDETQTAETKEPA